MFWGTFMAVHSEKLYICVCVYIYIYTLFLGGGANKWTLYHDNAPSHTAPSIRLYMAKIHSENLHDNIKGTCRK
jgi:hypothetical protein